MKSAKRGAMCALAFGYTVAPLAAQRGGGRAAAQARSTAAARSALDGWIVMRFRGAQLLDDSAATKPRSADSSGRAPTSLYPRVESVREAASGDTLFALHFGVDAGVVPLRDLTTVRLSAPSGAITSQEARIVSRRAFQAPRLPNARFDNAAAWRYGWAYVLITRTRRPSQGFRGWLLLAIPDSMRVPAPVPAPARGPGRPPSARTLPAR